MATIFTRIIEGELPGHFVWRDDTCVAFLSIEPLRRGHVLVVPREEVDHWLDVDDATWQHVNTVSRTIGGALQRAFEPEKVGLMIAGLEVAHCHVHLAPIDSVRDLDFANASPADDAELARVAEQIRDALRADPSADGVSD